MELVECPVCGCQYPPKAFRDCPDCALTNRKTPPRFRDDD